MPAIWHPTTILLLINEETCEGPSLIQMVIPRIERNRMTAFPAKTQQYGRDYDLHYEGLPACKRSSSRKYEHEVLDPDLVRHTGKTTCIIRPLPCQSYARLELLMR